MATQVVVEKTEAGKNPATVVYAVTIFVSAFLLFAVEPLVAKMILPWFGGAASVWAVCLLFFQTTLLAGYAYAHLLTRLRPKRQVYVHMAVLAVSLAALPIIPNPAWQPQGVIDPAGRILLVLALTVGLPFFVLSATGPLLQAWWTANPHPSQNRARVGHPGAGVGNPGADPKRNPYRFYALSNVGSMLALLSYPILVEPHVRTHLQATAWSIAYGLTAAVCGWIAFSAARVPVPVPTDEEPDAAPTMLVRVLWVALAAVASALLLAITNHISQNIAAVPFLWVAPLSLYLLSFILCFDSPRWYRRSIFVRLLAVALGGLAYALSDSFDPAPLVVLIPLFCGFLFVCCMFCHGEVARLKPSPKYLTSFYLMVALGGAIGGCFVALIAPRVFKGLAELPISVGACAVLGAVVIARDSEGVFGGVGNPHPSQNRARVGHPDAWVGHPGIWITAAIAGAIVVSLVVNARQSRKNVRFQGRNFYGMLRVYEKMASLPPAMIPDPLHPYDPPDPRYRELVNGTIDHGLQFLTPSMRDFATTYYSAVSGVGVAITQEEKRGPLRVGVIGLGAGTLATYGRPGDVYRFYDINPLVIDVAQHWFTFLRDSLAKVDIVPGDARLSLEHEAPQNFNVLAVDAFSGDSIPVHLLTLEAFKLYFKHLRPGGVLAVHVSNRYLDLIPVVRGAAERLGKKTIVMSNAEDEDKEIFDSTWVLVSDHELPYKEALFKAGEVTVSDGPRVLWTDDYSSVWSLLKSGGD